jgi:hypothetical protein
MEWVSRNEEIRAESESVLFLVSKGFTVCEGAASISDTGAQLSRIFLLFPARVNCPLKWK